MSTDKKIHVKIVSAEGHTDKYLNRNEAANTIKALCNNEAKWLYIDGIHVGNTDNLGIEELMGAGDITLTNQLAGGKAPKWLYLVRKLLRAE
jgi:hypothetical protein